MWDHVGLGVSDPERSRDFYTAVLAPLGCTVGARGDGWTMMKGAGNSGGFWFGATGQVTTPTHLAFAAATRAQVHAFHEAALAAGGRDNGPPGLRPYQPNYYAAFVLDPDGHNVEAVCRAAEG